MSDQPIPGTLGTPADVLGLLHNPIGPMNQSKGSARVLRSQIDPSPRSGFPNHRQIGVIGIPDYRGRKWSA